MSDGTQPMVTEPDLSVVIVSYRTCDQVADCLASLYTGGLSGLRSPEVILVDNASGDGTVERVRREFAQVCVVDSPENLGFARANNRGIAQTRGRNVLLLNPDTLVPEGALKWCVDYLDAQRPEVGAMTCRVQSPDGSLQPACSRRLITPWGECSRALGLDRIFSKSPFFNPEPIPGWDRSDERPVPCILGAFMLIRREALQRVGGLDEDYFLMYEDTDWCKRAGNAGYEIRYWPGAFITHIGGQSWKQEPIETYANSQVASLLYFRKHHPRAVGTVKLFSRVGMELKIALLRLRLLRKPDDAWTRSHLPMAVAAREALRTGALVPPQRGART